VLCFTIGRRSQWAETARWRIAFGERSDLAFELVEPRRLRLTDE
jgi:hypothetical protein